MHTYKIAPYLKEIIKVQRRYMIIILESRRCTKYDDVIMGEKKKFRSALTDLYIYLYLESGHLYIFVDLKISNTIDRSPSFLMF